MAVSGSAAQAAVRAYHGDAANAGPASNRGTFQGRQVTELPAGAQAPTAGDRKRALANAGAQMSNRSGPATTSNLDSGAMAPAVSSELSAAVRMVSRVEQDIRRADELLKKSRRQMLTDAEWRDLSGLISSTGQDLMALDDRWGEGLRRSMESGASSQPETEALRELGQRLANARDHFHSDEMPWEGAIRRIETALPGARGEPVVVESRIVAGTALGARLKQDYPTEDVTNRDWVARCSHVPDLEQTVLMGADGELLFSALRHGFIEANALNGDMLAMLADDELKALVVDFNIAEFEEPVSMDSAFGPRIAEFCSSIRTDPRMAWQFLMLMRMASGRRMAREVAAAALVADPEKFRSALDGETVDLNLFVIALVRRADLENCIAQASAFKSLARSGLLDLQVRNPDGEPLTVKADVRVSQFFFSAEEAEEERALFEDDSYWQAVRLLVPETPEELSSAIVTRAAAMRTRALELQTGIFKLATSHIQTFQKLGVDRPEALSMASRLYRLGNQMRRLDTNAGALVATGQQLKTMLLERGDLTVRAEEHAKAAARLALFAHLMGGTPLLSCASGSDFARKLDAEIKFLATVADNRGGQLPPVDRDSRIWERARDDFRAH